MMRPQNTGTTAASALNTTPISLRIVKRSIRMIRASKVATIGIKLYLIILLKLLAQGRSCVTGLP